MGLGDFSNDDSSNDEETKSSPSKTYVHFYEEGHENMPNYSGNVAEVVNKAYHLAKGSGDARNFFNSDNEYEDHVHAFSEFTVAMGEAIDGDFSRAINFLLGPASDNPKIRQKEAEFYAGQLADWLDQNPEVGEILVDRIMTHEDQKDEDE